MDQPYETLVLLLLGVKKCLSPCLAWDRTQRFFTCYNIMERLYFNMYVSLPSGARAIDFDTKLHKLPFSVFVCSKGSGKSVQIRRLD